MRKRYLTASLGAFMLALVLAISPLMALASQGGTGADFTVRVLESDSPYSLPKVNEIGIASANPGMAQQRSRSARAVLPATYDLRDSNDVTAVKDQNIFGTCWAFAAIAAFESALLCQGQASASSLDLSEMQLAYFSDWTASEAQAEALGATGQVGEGLVLRYGALQTGGNAWTAAYIIARGTGVITEQQAPYANDARTLIHEAVDDWNGVSYQSSEWDPNGAWTLDPSLATASVYQMHDMGFRNVTNHFNPDGTYEADTSYVDTMKRDLMEHGALALSFCASAGRRTGAVDEYTNVETGGRFVNKSTGANHMATVVGWDDDYPADNFTYTPSGNGAWIVKNSYGSLTSPEGNVYPWGIDNSGYVYLSYYDASIDDYSWYTPSTSAQDSQITLQYDLLGFSSGSMTELENSQQVQQANIFTAPEDMVLNAVSATSVNGNAAVTTSVYLLDDASTVPTSGTLASSQTDQFNGEFYTQLELASPVAMKAGQRFAIVQEITSGGVWYASVEAGRAVNTFNSFGINARAVVNPGESFIMQGGTWSDITSSRVATQLSAKGQKAGNVMIKAFGNPQEFIEETVNPEKMGGDDNSTSGDDEPGIGTNHPLAGDPDQDASKGTDGNTGTDGASTDGGLGLSGNGLGADNDDGGYSVDSSGTLSPAQDASRNGSAVSSDPKLAQTGDETQIVLILFSMTSALVSAVLLGLGLRRSDIRR